MKTAISVPDDLYERATKRARELGMSRSELFARAAARYLDDLDDLSVTERIDAVVAGLKPGDPSGVEAVAGGRRLLAGGDDW